MAEAEAGMVIENPVTGERGIILEAPKENPQRRLLVELHVTPGGAVAGEHLHPDIVETFEVLEGELEVSLDRELRTLEPGERIEVPAGSWHDWRNAGSQRAVVRVEIVPGDRFVEMIKTIFGLGIDGKTNDKGMPSLLQLLAIGTEFRDVIAFRRPPPLAQRLAGAVLAPIAHRRGYRGIYPRYEEMKSMGTPEQARSGAPLTPAFGPGPGPPG